MPERVWSNALLTPPLSQPLEGYCTSFNVKLDKTLCSGMVSSSAATLEGTWFSEELSYLRFSGPNGPLRLLLRFTPPCSRTIEVTSHQTLKIALGADAPESRLCLAVARVVCNECASCGACFDRVEHFCPDCLGPSGHPFQLYCSAECMTIHRTIHRRHFCRCRKRIGSRM